MTGIRVASLLHLLWGIYLVFFWYRVPQPFGAFEPFLDAMNHRQLGWLFVHIAVLAIFKNFLPKGSPWWAGPVLCIPQQVVLVWGLMGGLYLIYSEEHVDRSLLALCYMISITAFHTHDVFKLWHDSMIQREVDK